MTDKLKQHIETLEKVESGYFIPLGAPTIKGLAADSLKIIKRLKQRNKNQRTVIEDLHRTEKKHTDRILELANKLKDSNNHYNTLENVNRGLLGNLEKARAALTEEQRQHIITTNTMDKAHEELNKVRLERGNLRKELDAMKQNWNEQTDAFTMIHPHVEREDFDRDGGQSLVNAIIGALDELKARREDARNECKANHPASNGTKYATPSDSSAPNSPCTNCGHKLAWSEKDGCWYHADFGLRACQPFKEPASRKSRADEDGDLQVTHSPDVDPQLTNTLKFLTDEYGPAGVDEELGRLFPKYRAARGGSIIETGIRLAKATEGNTALIIRLLIETTDVWRENERLRQQTMTDEQASGEGELF